MTTSYNGSPQLSGEKPRIHCMTVRTPALPCLSQLLCRNPRSGTMSSLQNSENPSFSPEETNFALPPHLTWWRNNSGFPFIKLSCPSRTLGPERLSYVTIMQCIHTFFIRCILIYAICLPPHRGCEFLNSRDQSQYLCIPRAWHSVVIQYMFAEKNEWR